MMFNWLTGRSKSNLPEPTAIQALKSRQVEQLKTFNQNVSEIQRDIEYRVNTVINGSTISLYITLPPQFPQEKPVVKVSPRVSHPWVNDQMLISGSPGINNFMVHSDLGKVISEVVKEFQRNPPVLLPAYDFGGGFPHVTSPSVSSTTSSPPSAMPQPSVTYPPSTSPANQLSSASQQPPVPGYVPNIVPTSHPPPYPAQSGPGSNMTGVPAPPSYSSLNLGQTNPDQATLSSSTPIGGSRMPDMPSSIAQLSSLSKQELMELFNDEGKLLQMIEASPEVSQLARDRETLTGENERIARANLSLKPVLEDKKKTLLEKYDIFNEIKQTYDANSEKQDQLRLKYDPQTIQDNVKVAAMEAEEQSESIAEDFLEGKITVEDFKKIYMEKRKLSHLRRTKEERLGQCLTSQSRGSF